MVGIKHRGDQKITKSVTNNVHCENEVQIFSFYLHMTGEGERERQRERNRTDWERERGTKQTLRILSPVFRAPLLPAGLLAKTFFMKIPATAFSGDKWNMSILPPTSLDNILTVRQVEFTPIYKSFQLLFDFITLMLPIVVDIST